MNRADYLVERPAFDVPDDLPLGCGKYVYVHLDADDRPLYVGCTRTPLARTRRHATEKPWFAEVVETVWYPSPTPEAVEYELQRLLEPAHCTNRKRSA